MDLPKKQQGFAILEGLLILVIVGLVAFVGYRIYSMRNSINKQDTSTASQKTSAGQVPNINSSDDLSSAEQAVNQVNPDDSNSDLSQLDNQAASL